MSDLVPLDPRPLGEDIVALLEEWLDHARAGKLSSIAIAGVFRDGNTGRAWSELHSISAQIGAIALMQADIIATATPLERT